MKNLLSTTLSFTLLLLLSCAQKSNLLDELKTLIEAERAFAMVSENQGIRDAFMSYLAEGAIVFRPLPVDGRQAYANSSNVPGMLLWQPIYADIAASGELGYTTGPWEFRQNGKGDNPIAFGHYVSIWLKQADGSWRVLVDVGIPHQSRNDSVIVLTMPEDIVSRRHFTKTKSDIHIEKDTLLAKDQAFCTASISAGFADAFQRFAANDVRLYRPGHLPFVGKAASLAAIADSVGTFSWETMTATVSAACDFGYTIGLAELRYDAAALHPDKRFSYLRIWKKQENDSWAIVLDIVNTIPPASNQNNE